jgi:ABC-type transporter Mla maintaining outer membrane lipid asymmetry permease subunit MlaE
VTAHNLSLAKRPVGFLSRIRSEYGLLGMALAGIGQLRRQPARAILLHYYMLAGASSVGQVVLRASVLGTLLIGYVINVVEADAQSAIRLMVQVVLREGGPLFAALIVMLQGGIEVTGSLVRMRERGEIDGLRLLNIDPLELFVAPCLWGVTGATVVLTLYFNIIMVVGGILLSSLIADLSVAELGERFLMQVHMGDLFYAAFKSVLFGMAIGVTSCYHGLLAPMSTLRDGSHLLSRSVMQTLLFISITNAVAAYVAHGVVFFGVVRI